MTKVALHSVLIKGQESAYEREHASVPDDLLAALQAAGVRDWSIWRSGGHLFHVVDVVDFEVAMAELGDDPVNQRWQEHMAKFVANFVTTEGDSMQIRHVWTMRGQLDAEDAGA